MEETHKARYRERVMSFHALSKSTTLPKFPCVHNPKVLQVPFLGSSEGGTITEK